MPGLAIPPSLIHCKINWWNSLSQDIVMSLSTDEFKKHELGRFMEYYEPNGIFISRNFGVEGVGIETRTGHVASCLSYGFPFGVSSWPL